MTLATYLTLHHLAQLKVALDSRKQTTKLMEVDFLAQALLAAQNRSDPAQQFGEKYLNTFM